MSERKTAANVYFIIIVVLSFGIFYWLNHLSDSQIKFLLDFYKNVVEVFFSNYHYYNEESAYYWGNGYVIGKECLGLNIIALIFAVCGLAGAGMASGRKKFLWIIASALMAAVIGVFANILRLLSSIYFIIFAKFELIHSLLGIVIYLAVLIFCYVFTSNAVKNNSGSEDIEEHI